MVREITAVEKKTSSYESIKKFMEEHGNKIVIGIGVVLALVNIVYGLLKSDLANITMGFIVYLLTDERLVHMDMFEFNAEEDEEENNEKEN